MKNSRQGGEIVTLPQGWPYGDWCPPKAAVERMTQPEIGALIADVQHEFDFLKAWNARRSDWIPTSDFFEGVPPIRSMDEYTWNVKTKQSYR